MSRMVSIDADEWAGVLKRIRDLETATPLFATSVTSGRVRVGGTAVLLVDSSGGVVIQGTLNGDGTITWTGDVNVNGGGKITVAGSVPMVLGITSNGRPGVEFAGGRLSSDGSRIALESGSSTVGAGGTFASISAGSYAILAKTDGAYILNLPTTTQAPNLYADPATGKLYRSIGTEV